MAVDTTRYPMLGGEPPECPVCYAKMQRYEIRGLHGLWICPDLECSDEMFTDAQMDERLQNEAEAAEERRLARG